MEDGALFVILMVVVPFVIAVPIAALWALGSWLRAHQ